MVNYTNLKATADRLITANGKSLTIRGVPTAGDPVTGLSGSDGSTRTVYGFPTKIDFRTFPESMTQSGDKMLLLEGDSAVTIGEKWIDGTEEWDIVAVQQGIWGHTSDIIYKALVRG